MIIHRSPIPSVAIPDKSLFTFLSEGRLDCEIPGTTPIFADAPTGRSITSSEFEIAYPSLGWDLRNIFARNLEGVDQERGYDDGLRFEPRVAVCVARLNRGWVQDNVGGLSVYSSRARASVKG